MVIRATSEWTVGMLQVSICGKSFLRKEKCRGLGRVIRYPVGGLARDQSAGSEQGEGGNNDCRR